MLDLFNINKNFYLNPGEGEGFIGVPEEETLENSLNEVYKYLTTTPENTNPNILRSFEMPEVIISQIMKDPVTQNMNVWKDLYDSNLIEELDEELGLREGPGR